MPFLTNPFEVFVVHIKELGGSKLCKNRSADANNGGLFFGFPFERYFMPEEIARAVDEMFGISIDATYLAGVGDGQI